jgi:predicted DNA-binding protein with PD1-like motif
MTDGTLKLYVPAGNWLVETLTDYCMANGIGNAEVGGIGSIGSVWTLVNPNGKLVVKESNDEPSYEMTNLVGNVTLRQGRAFFDRSKLNTGSYPQFDTTVKTYNCYVHVHVAFADSSMIVRGGHLLDAQITIGAELFVRPVAGSLCRPGIEKGTIPADCMFSEMVSVPPFGSFCNWDPRFWFPPPDQQRHS